MHRRHTKERKKLEDKVEDDRQEDEEAGGIPHFALRKIQRYRKG